MSPNHHEDDGSCARRHAGENRLHLKCAVADPQLQESKQNLTKAIDRDAEDLSGLKTGLTILDLSGNPITSKLDLEDIFAFATFRRDPQRPKPTPFIAAKEPALAEEVLKLLKRK